MYKTTTMRKTNQQKHTNSILIHRGIHYISMQRERERGGITGRRWREPPGGGSRGGGAAGVNGGEDIHEGEQNSDDDGGVDRQKQRLGVSYLLQPTLPAHFLFLLPNGFSQIPQILATIWATPTIPSKLDKDPPKRTYQITKIYVWIGVNSKVNPTGWVLDFDYVCYCVWKSDLCSGLSQ